VAIDLPEHLQDGLALGGKVLQDLHELPPSVSQAVRQEGLEILRDVS